jgi:hypothetical protein
VHAAHIRNTRVDKQSFTGRASALKGLEQLMNKLEQTEIRDSTASVDGSELPGSPQPHTPAAPSVSEKRRSAAVRARGSLGIAEDVCYVTDAFSEAVSR